MNEEVRLRASEFAADLRRDPGHRDVLGVVVAGSAARGEERWRDGRLDSDIDVMVIGRSPSIRLDRTRAVERVIARHAGRGIEGGRIPVGTLDYATLANYEARRNGVVVDGDPAVLEKISLARQEQIPSWEGVRLLANRLFEQLKHRAGLAEAEWATRKSYEAIGEAQLVLEGRYKPSFRERAEEIHRRPLGGPVATASRRYLEAEDARRSGTVMPEADADLALEDLFTQLQHAMQRHSGSPGGLRAQLGQLARTERHFAHRAYWAALGLRGGRDGMHAPTQDPIVRLWRAAAVALSGKGSGAEAAELVRLWSRCPQILRTTKNPR